MIFITGDIHVPYDISKLNSINFSEGKHLTKSDYVICTGDFGLIWSLNEDDKSEKYWTEWFTNKPWTTLFVDGNHENFERLNKLKVVNKFGGSVGVINESIYHLKRSEIYIIDGVKIFTFGGATSIDKNRRFINIDWWKEELPSFQEVDYALQNLEKHNYTVDYILTHTGPKKIVEQIGIMEIEDPMGKILDKIDNITNFKEWYFGHFHCDCVINNKYFCQYQQIKKIA